MTIIVAGAAVGIQTYPEFADMLFFSILDDVILYIFVAEVLGKIIGEGLRPYMYFIGPEYLWNLFDFSIVFVSLPFLGFFEGSNSSIGFLRMVRLARLGKLIRKIPALQMIMNGLANGMKSLGFTLLLLFLVFYVYAVAGFYMFSANDPFHFGDLQVSLFILLRIALLENAADIMFINIYGCDVYTEMYVRDEDKTPLNRLFWCTNPSTSHFIAPVYFISFIVISALVMFSLFIGAISMAMQVINSAELYIISLTHTTNICYSLIY